jgi:hypothetical protein
MNSNNAIDGKEKENGFRLDCIQLIISDYEICMVSEDLYVQSTKKGIVF